MRTTTTSRRGGRSGTSRVRLGLALGGVLLAVLLLGAGGTLLLGGGQAPGTVGGPFALTDGAGRPVTQRDFRGKYLLVYFGYTACPDACPTTLSEVADAMTRLGPMAARVQPLFITLDPARDTPAVVRTYAAAFDPRLIGLTGTQAQVDQVAREYRVEHSIHRTGPAPGDYSVDHSSVLFLMGPTGRLLAPLRADETGAALAADITRHLS